MLFYDLALNSWVRAPGSTSPPWITPVVGIGSRFNVFVSFCEGETLIMPEATAWNAVLRLDGDFSGTEVSSTTDAISTGENAIIFILDLTTVDASAYFVNNPTYPTAKCQFQIGYTLDGDPQRTAPLEIILQNDYAQSP
jgi:hypothetical protein